MGGPAWLTQYILVQQVLNTYKYSEADHYERQLGRPGPARRARQPEGSQALQVFGSSGRQLLHLDQVVKGDSGDKGFGLTLPRAA